MSPHLSKPRLAELGTDLPEAGKEAHLEDCARCRAALETYRGSLQALRDQEPPPEPLFSRQRLILKAIAEADAQAVRGAKWFSGKVAAVGVGLALAAAAMVVGLLPSAIPPGGFRITEGTVASPGQAHRAGEIVARPQSLVVPEGLAPALLVLSEGTRVRAAPGTRFSIRSDGEIAVSLGRLDLWVRPRPERPLQVVTPEATVRVIGTVFSVLRTAEQRTRVELSEGTIEVSAAAGGPLRLLSGKATLEVGQPAAVNGDSRGAKPAAASLRPRARRPDLEGVRERLRAGQLAEARRLLASARMHSPSLEDQAELDILEAEMLLASGKVDLATAAYLRIFEAHPGTSQAEAALFAAAQLSLQHDPSGAAQLLGRYLERYPNGRFWVEATQLLSAFGRRAGEAEPR